MNENQFTGPNCSLNIATTSADLPPLLMLHGVTRRWQTFLPMASSLGMSSQLHAIDFRGHGNSERTPERYRVVDYVEDVIAYLDSLPQRRVAIYGHSLGAMVAAQVAAERSDRVAGIVMEDPPFRTMGESIGETVLLSFFSAFQKLAGGERDIPTIARELADVQLFDPKQNQKTRLGDVRDSVALRFTAACLQQLDPEVLNPIVAGKWLNGYETQDILQRVQCPALLIQADANSGGMLPDAEADLIGDLVEDLVHLKVPDCGHLVHWSHTSLCLNSTHAFLESLERNTD